LITAQAGKYDVWHKTIYNSFNILNYENILANASSIFIRMVYNLIMIRIIVCDDDKTLLDTYTQLCKKVSNKYNIAAEIKGYSSGSDLMFDLEDPKFQSTLDMLFLDISMPGLSGVEVAREARALGYTGVIIFITASEEHFRDAFDVGAFHYITKGESMRRFEEVFLRAVEHLNDSNKKEITLSCWGEYKKIKISDIEYFEVVNRVIIVYYDNKSFELQGSLQKLEITLANYGFQRIHRNFLVSLSYIKQMTFKYVVLLNGKELPVGRNYYSGLKSAVNKMKL